MPKYLIKASDEVLSFCACEEPLAALPGQLDCPWCGCGWLISCIDCRKAFTFAKVVQVDLTYKKIARYEAVRRGLVVDEDEVAEEAETTRRMMEPLPLGATVAYLDGRYFAVEEKDVRFTGLLSEHKMDRLPQAEARTDPSRLNILKDASYWLARERPDRD